MEWNATGDGVAMKSAFYALHQRQTYWHLFSVIGHKEYNHHRFLLRISIIYLTKKFIGPNFTLKVHQISAQPFSLIDFMVQFE